MKYHTVESHAVSLEVTALQAVAIQALAIELKSRREFWGADESELDAETPSPLSCSFGPDGKLSLTASNVVGIIGVDDVHVTIVPKIPLQHFLHLLNVVRPLPRQSKKPTQGSEGELVYLVVSWFLDAVFDLLRGGLRRDYRVTEDELAYVRGSIRPELTMSRFYRGVMDVSCRFDEHNYDGPLNRILRAALDSILRMQLFREDLRSRARRALAHFDGVGLLQPQDFHATIDRTTHRYSEAVDLARLVLSGTGRDIAMGGSHARCFLFPTASIVEQAIRKLLATYFSSEFPVLKRSLRLSGSYLTVTPDLVFRGKDAIGDIKYKLTTDQWIRSDLYQSVAFAAAFGVSRGAVISFTSSTRDRLPVARFGPISITGLSWPACESWDPKLAESALILSVEKWLREG